MTHVREMSPADWEAVAQIYQEGVEGGNATFESTVPAWQTFDASRLRLGRLVAIDDAHAVIGWVAASAVSSREAYRGVVEHSVYVAERARGRGIGRLLLNGFVAIAELNGIWTIQSSVFPENTASLRLHSSAGFREVGRRERIAQSRTGPWRGKWRDTVLIERRSTMNGMR